MTKGLVLGAGREVVDRKLRNTDGETNFSMVVLDTLEMFRGDLEVIFSKNIKCMDRFIV